MNEAYRRGRGPWPCMALAACGLVALLSMGACGGTAASNTGPAAAAAAGPATASTSTSESPSPAAVATTAPPAPPAPKPSATHPSPTAATKQPAKPAYGKALTQWKQGATAISAQQGEYWLAAASALQAGQSTDGGNTSGYPAAVTELKDLAGLPDAQQTPAQNAEYHHDIDALNTFFGTPGLYS